MFDDLTSRYSRATPLRSPHRIEPEDSPFARALWDRANQGSALDVQTHAYLSKDVMNEFERAAVDVSRVAVRAPGIRRARRVITAAWARLGESIGRARARRR